MGGNDRFEQLFAAKAVAKAFQDEVVKPLEEECKATALRDFEEQGIDRRRSKVFDPKSAYVSVVAGEEGGDAEKFEVVDGQELCDWFEECDADWRGFAVANIEQFAEWHFLTTGECPDGCHVLRYRAEGKKPYARVVAKPEKVLPVLREHMELMEGIGLPMLLEGGTE